MNAGGRNLVHAVVVAAEEEVTHVIARVAGVLAHHKKRVKEVGVVILMVDDVVIGGDVAAAQGRKAIDMMCMPVAQVLNVRVPGFDLAEHFLLIVSVLEETRAGPTCIRTRVDDASDFYFVMRSLAGKGAEQSAARLVYVIHVALVKD